MKNKKFRNFVFQTILLLIVISASFMLLDKFGREKQGSSKSEEAGQTIAVPSQKISALIIPHHDLMKDERADFFASLKNSVSSKTIILVSPNHFNSGNAQVITTDKEWQLASGKISPGTELAHQIVSLGLAADDGAAFVNEHGILNILPDISANFSNSKVIPLIIRQNTSRAVMDSLAKGLYQICIDNCLVISSVDFSHYQPGALAEIHDSLSIKALTNLDEDMIWKAEVDSNQSLYLAMKFAKSNNTDKFNLAANTNSGKLANSADAESTSYIVGWYGTGKSQKITNDFSFIVGGDMMFDRYINYKYPGMKIYDIWNDFGQRVFWGTDLSVANLEGPISPSPRPTLKSETMVFNFPPETANVLSWLGLNAVSLANNHSGNNGKAGFDNTVKVLNEKGIASIGKQDGFDATGIKEFSDGNTKLTVFAIDALSSKADLTAQIKQKKAEGSLVLIFPHWGVEYAPKHSGGQEDLAHSWIDAGADIVIGSHPHVIQDAEIYKNRPIFYSMGNLLFDQDFSKETQRGLIIAGRFHENSLDLVLLPTKSTNYKPSLLTGDEKMNLIKDFRAYLGAPICSDNYGCDKITINLK